MTTSFPIFTQCDASQHRRLETSVIQFTVKDSFKKVFTCSMRCSGASPAHLHSLNAGDFMWLGSQLVGGIAQDITGRKIYKKDGRCHFFKACYFLFKLKNSNGPSTEPWGTPAALLQASWQQGYVKEGTNYLRESSLPYCCPRQPRGMQSLKLREIAVQKRTKIDCLWVFPHTTKNTITFLCQIRRRNGSSVYDFFVAHSLLPSMPESYCPSGIGFFA